MNTQADHTVYDAEGFLVDSALLSAIPPLAEVGAEPYRVRTQAPEKASQNVQNVYKGWATEQLRLDLDTRRNKSMHVFYNTGNDFNIATAIRSGAAFAVGGLLICERQRYDRRGTVGTHLLQHVAYVEKTLDAIAALKQDGYRVYAVDYIEGKNPTSMYDVEFPEKSAFVYGMEGDGLTDEIIDACDEMVFIPMPGGVLRSLNLSVSASLMMAEYCRQWPNSRIFGE